MEDKIKLYVIRKDNLTIFETADFGFRVRLAIVLSEKGYRVCELERFNTAIAIPGEYLANDAITEIINEQFNPDEINIEWLGE